MLFELDVELTRGVKLLKSKLNYFFAQKTLNEVVCNSLSALAFTLASAVAKLRRKILTENLFKNFFLHFLMDERKVEFSVAMTLAFGIDSHSSRTGSR